MDTVDTEATVVDTEAIEDTVLDTAGATMVSVRPMPNLRPRLSLTMDTVDTEATVVDTEAMEDTVLDTAGATTAMGAMEDMVDTMEVTEATEDSVMATASN